MFDLVGMTIRENRRKAKITILRRSTGWSMDEVRALVYGLKPFSIVHQHPQQPQVLMIREAWTKEEIVGVLKKDDFEYVVLQGYDNPELPFSVPDL